jgi:thioredoxin 1
MSKVIEVTNQSFQTEVLKSEHPVLVDFHATWCGPCKMITPIIEGFAGEFAGKVKFAKVDVDQAPELAATYNITGVPTLIFFKQGKADDVMVGLGSPKSLRERLERYAAAGKPSPSNGRAQTCSCSL